jgi:hypothetical protein
MSYWLIKARPRQNQNFSSFPVKGKVDRWHARYLPRDWSAGDVVFVWAAAPTLRVIGIGELTDPDAGRGGGVGYFKVCYWSDRLDGPTIAELRSVPAMRGAAFLHPGPGRTVFPLQSHQGRVLTKALRNRSAPVIAAGRSRDDLSKGFPDVDLDLVVTSEGRQHLVTHLRRERDSRLAKAKRHAVLKALGRLQCEACGLDFRAFANGLGLSCCEVHHTRPIGFRQKAEPTHSLTSRFSVPIAIEWCTERCRLYR